MKYVVAVSGGVDSMALLHMMVASGETSIVVAHFDHGIRPDSHLDAELVRTAAKKYGLVYKTKKENLGERASEARARERRYAFLRSVAKEHGARIVTAHHLDDLTETIAINVVRGTGWRGVAVLDSLALRPLIDLEKETLVNYAKKHKLVWREDSTNKSDAYLRNRIRKKTSALPQDYKRQLRSLHARQKELKNLIEHEVAQLVGSGPVYERYFFTHIPPEAAAECLRFITKGLLTRPQLVRLLHAIKTAQPKSTYQAGTKLSIHFTTRQFSLQLIKL